MQACFSNYMSDVFNEALMVLIVLFKKKNCNTFLFYVIYYLDVLFCFVLFMHDH